MRCAVVQAFSGPVVERVHRLIHLDSDGELFLHLEPATDLLGRETKSYIAHHQRPLLAGDSAHIAGPAQASFGLHMGLDGAVEALGIGVAQQLAADAAAVASQVCCDGSNSHPAAAQGVGLVSFFSAQVCVVQSAFLGDWLVNKRASYALLGQLVACCLLHFVLESATNIVRLARAVFIALSLSTQACHLRSLSGYRILQHK